MSGVLYYTRKEVTNNSRRNISFSLERCAMRVAKCELFIFDDIRPDASDKFCSPICRLESLTFYTGNIYFRIDCRS